MSNTLSEERWARMIEEVARVSEASNTRQEEERMEETDIFRIAYYHDEYGKIWYKWYNLRGNEWEYSKKSFRDKGECLLDFINERVNFINS